MQKLRFVNANGVELDLTSGYYGITKWNGFSNANLNLQTQQVPYQDGSVFIDGLLNNRELSVTLCINDNNDLAKRYELRNELIKTLNPKLGEGYLYYKNDFLERRIKVIPQLPVIPNKNSNESGTVKASLSWTACSVYWEDVVEKEVSFSVGQFPVIKNEGDIPAQMEIDFFTNNVINPSIIRMNGEKKISYKGTLNNSLYINTKFGQKQVYSEDLKFNISEFHGNLNSICYASDLGIFVAVSQGVIFYSYDTVNWKIVSVGVSRDLFSVTYSSDLNLFVAVGDSEVILYTSFSVAENQIQNITPDSDMNLNLEVGDNKFRLTKSSGNFSTRIKYRQLYLGV